jgi:hypothetical protein
METYELKDDLNVFGFQVKTFPEGIGEAFDTLIEKVPEGLNRSYYGISFFSDGKVVYIAAVEEKNPGEAEKHKYERYRIEKGKYYRATVRDWRTKTGSIKDVFHEMMQQKNVDHAKPCIEWYRNDDEMECMVKLV